LDSALAWLVLISAIISSWLALIPASRRSTYVVWRYSDQDSMQFPIQSLLTPECHDLGVTIDGIWIGE
jgi:hypothetical protein